MGLYGPDGTLARFTRAANGLHEVCEKLREQQKRSHEAQVEAVARILDPDAWEDDMPLPTRAATVAFHARRQASCDLARAAIIALDEVRGR